MEYSRSFNPYLPLNGPQESRVGKVSQATLGEMEGKKENKRSRLCGVEREEGRWGPGGFGGWGGLLILGDFFQRHIPI